jgi:hypothetical protein
MRKPAHTTVELRVCLFVGLLFTAGASAHADDSGRRPGASDQGRGGSTGRITGRVLRTWGSPMEARAIHVNGHRATTRKDGAFDMGGVPGKYDLWIEHARDERVTVYRGLTHRNLLLQHEGSFNIPPDRHRNQAIISGIVRGDFPFPMEKDHWMTVLFLSQAERVSWAMGGSRGQSGGSLGPRFGRMKVDWAGKPTLAGTLVVTGGAIEKSNRWIDPVFAMQPIVLNDKAETTAEVTLTHLSTGRIAGAVKQPGEYHYWQGHLGFQLAGLRDDIYLSCSFDVRPFDCPVPDLSALDGQYCMRLFDGTAHGGELQHCGGKLGMNDFSPTIEGPPKLQRLDKPGTVSTKTVLAWSGDEKAVYAVDVHWSYDGESSANTDGRGVDLRLYTTGTRLAWKDLGRYGIKTPPRTKYSVSVSRLIPYHTVDEVASASGPLSRTAEYQRAMSTPSEVKVGE